MKKGKFRWTVTLLTDSGSGHSRSRFDSDGYRIGDVKHCQYRSDAITIGRTYAEQAAPYERRKAVVRLRYSAVNVSETFLSENCEEGRITLIDPASPTGYREIAAL